jgi:hypothetical protein
LNNRQQREADVRLHTEQLPDAIVAATGLSRPLVEVTLRRLKESGHISKGGQHAPPLTSRDLARIVFGLAAMSATAAAAHCTEVAMLPLAEGDTIDGCAEAALAGLFDTAAGLRGMSYDIKRGEIIVGQSIPYFEIASRGPGGGNFIAVYGDYGASRCAAYVKFPIPQLARLAREILKAD